MRFGARHEVDVMFDPGHLAKVAVPHLVVEFKYFKYFVPPVFERAADLYCLVPGLFVFRRFPLRLSGDEMHAGGTSHVQE